MMKTKESHGDVCACCMVGWVAPLRKSPKNETKVRVFCMDLVQSFFPDPEVNTRSLPWVSDLTEELYAIYRANL